MQPTPKPTLSLARRAAHDLGTLWLRLCLRGATHTLAALGRWCGHRFVTAPLPSEPHAVRTTDGFSLGLRRVRASERPPHGPVLLLAGLGGTGDAFLLPERSLARFLAAQGFDCFIADLRGRRGSLPESGPLHFAWGLADYLERDLPALIEGVLAVSGAGSLHWLGHSMGGILAYAYLTDTEDPRVRSLVTLGSALDFTHGQSSFRTLALRKHWLPLLPYVPVASISRIVAFLLAAAPRTLTRFSYHPDNLEPAVAQRYLASTLCEVSPRELADLCSAVEAGGLRCPRTERPYASRAGRIRAPVLAVAGDDDHQCDARDVAATLALIGSIDKTFLCASRELGSAAPFGHEDLLVGQYAEPVLWPILAEWLAERS